MSIKQLLIIFILLVSVSFVTAVDSTTPSDYMAFDNFTQTDIGMNLKQDKVNNTFHIPSQGNNGKCWRVNESRLYYNDSCGADVSELTLNFTTRIVWGRYTTAELEFNITDVTSTTQFNEIDASNNIVFRLAIQSDKFQMYSGVLASWKDCGTSPVPKDGNNYMARIMHDNVTAKYNVTIYNASTGTLITWCNGTGDGGRFTKMTFQARQTEKVSIRYVNVWNGTAEQKPQATSGSSGTPSNFTIHLLAPASATEIYKTNMPYNLTYYLNNSNAYICSLYDNNTAVNSTALNINGFVGIDIFNRSDGNIDGDKDLLLNTYTENVDNNLGTGWQLLDGKLKYISSAGVSQVTVNWTSKPSTPNMTAEVYFNFSSFATINSFKFKNSSSILATDNIITTGSDGSGNFRYYTDVIGSWINCGSNPAGWSVNQIHRIMIEHWSNISLVNITLYNSAGTLITWCNVSAYANTQDHSTKRLDFQARDAFTETIYNITIWNGTRNDRPNLYTSVATSYNFSVAQSNTSALNYNANNTFTINYTVGNYKWDIRCCNSTYCTYSDNGNFTYKIYEDTTAPTTNMSVWDNATLILNNTWTNLTTLTVNLTCDDGTGLGCDTTYYCSNQYNNCTDYSIGNYFTISTSVVNDNYVFIDTFDRADGLVGNGWENKTGVAVSPIVNITDGKLVMWADNMQLDVFYNFTKNGKNKLNVTTVSFEVSHSVCDSQWFVYGHKVDNAGDNYGARLYTTGGKYGINGVNVSDCSILPPSMHETITVTYNDNNYMFNMTFTNFSGTYSFNNAGLQYPYTHNVTSNSFIFNTGYAFSNVMYIDNFYVWNGTYEQRPNLYSDGINYYRYFSEDLAGNNESVKLSVIKKTTNPVVNITHKTIDFINTPTWDINYTTTTLSNCSLYYDGLYYNSSFSNDTGNFTLTSITEGNHTYYVKCESYTANELTGYYGLSANYTLIADFTVPSLTDNSGLNGTYTYYNQTIYNITVDDTYLFLVETNVTCDNGTNILSKQYTYGNGTIADTLIETINNSLCGMSGNINIITQASDTHTDGIVNISALVLNKELKVDSGGKELKLVPKDKLLVNKIEIQKKTDRISYIITPNKDDKKPQNKMEFYIEGQNIQKITGTESKYKGHFVQWNGWGYESDGITPLSKWIDFNNDLGYPIAVSKENNKWLVSVDCSKDLCSKPIIYNSIGGLNINTIVVNYTYNIFDINFSESYLNPVYEGQNTPLNISVYYNSIKYNLSNTSQTIYSRLEWNGTTYNALGYVVSTGSTYSEYRYFVNVTVPHFNQTVNVTHSWGISLRMNNGTERTFTTDYQNQTVYSLNILAGISCGANVTIATFYGRDEESEQALHPYLLNIEINLTIPSLGISQISNFGFDHTSNNYSICIPALLGGVNYTLDSIMEYSSNDTATFPVEFYVDRKYHILSYDFNNNTIPITQNLYMLLNTRTTEVVLKVLDKISGEGVENAYIKILRFYPETGNYLTVEIEKTDANGQTLGKLVLADVFYKFLIEKDDEILFAGQVEKILSTTKTFYISQTEDYMKSFNLIDDVATSVSCNEVTKTCVFTWSDLNNIADTGIMKVYRISTAGKVLLDTETLTSSAGTLTYTIVEDTTNRQYVAEAYITSNTGYSLQEVGKAVLNYMGELKDQFGVLGLMPVFLLFLVMCAVFLDIGATGVILGSLVCLIGVVMLGLVPISVMSVTSLIVIGVILVWRLRE